MLVKAIDGKLRVDRHDTTARDRAWGGALVGGALAVVAAPLAIEPLSVVATQDGTWAGVGGIVGHFWNNIPKGQLLRMSDLLESGQAALVVVASINRDRTIEALLQNATDGDRRRDRWRRHRAGLRGSVGAGTAAVLITTPPGGSIGRPPPTTLDQQRQRAAGHDAHHVRRQHLERAADPRRRCPSPTAHPMYAAAGIVVTEMATPTASLPAVS